MNYLLTVTFYLWLVYQYTIKYTLHSGGSTVLFAKASLYIKMSKNLE